METIFLAVAALLSSGREVQTGGYCDDVDCFSVSTLTEDGRGEPLFWFTFPRYEEFRTGVIAPYRERCRYDDLLVVLGDRFTPPGTAGSYTRLQPGRQEALHAEALITTHSLPTVTDFHHVLAHEWGHYLHDQYCLTVDQEAFAGAVGDHFSGAVFDTRIVR